MSSETIKQWIPPEEEVLPYKITVSTKYLDLTKRKLELTRLPREIDLPDDQAWSLGTPKSALEPLLDAWLDASAFNWRDQERQLNDALPQYRTMINLPPSTKESDNESKSLNDSSDARRHRIHFVHKRSTLPRDDNDIVLPLLYVHGYPGSCIEVQKVIDSLTSVLPTHLARKNDANVRFHVVAPSIPGFGFSDASISPHFRARETMLVFDALMRRIGYGARYVVACSELGWDVARWWFAAQDSGCCAVFLGRNGPLQEMPIIQRDSEDRPKVQRIGSSTSIGSGSSGRWKDVFKKSRKGKTDKPDTKSSASLSPTGSLHLPSRSIQDDRVGKKGQQDPLLLPQTRALALCDSPAGLLGHTIGQLYALGSLHLWTTNETLTWTMLQWLPGPEAALRWSHATAQEQFTSNLEAKSNTKVKLGVVAYDQQATDTSSSTSTTTPKVLMQDNALFIPIFWSRTRNGKAGIPALDNASDFIVDLREFCAQICRPKELEGKQRQQQQQRQSVDLPERPRTAIRHYSVGESQEGEGAGADEKDEDEGDNDDDDDDEVEEEAKKEKNEGEEIGESSSAAEPSSAPRSRGIPTNATILKQGGREQHEASKHRHVYDTEYNNDNNNDNDNNDGDELPNDVIHDLSAVASVVDHHETEYDENKRNEEHQRRAENFSDVLQTHDEHSGVPQQRQRWWKRPVMMFRRVIDRFDETASKQEKGLDRGRGASI